MGVSEGDLPVICELYVGYIDVHVEATQSDAALAASSSFKLILNGIRSACHNPQDQQQQQEDHTRPREVANDDGFCFGTLIAGALRQMGHQPCPRTMHGGAVRKTARRETGNRSEMGDGMELEGRWSDGQRTNPTVRTLIFMRFSRFPLVPSPAHLIIGQRPKQFKKALYIYWQNGGVTTLAEDMVAASRLLDLIADKEDFI